MIFRRAAGIFVGGMLMLSGLFAGAAPAQAASCGTLLPLAVPACGALWGFSVPGGSSATLASDESTVGRKFDISYHFHTVGDTLPSTNELSEVASGHLLHVNIESGPYSYASIASGAEDAGLIRQAHGVASINAPVYVTFTHEPDVKSKAVRGTPAEYVAAWRHVHDVFVGNGATNAVWVWVTTGWYPNFPTYAGFYPGNDDVDWISWEAYSTTSCSTGRNALNGTFANSAGPMYTWLHDGHGAAAGIDVTKPEMISEYGAVYDSAVPGAQGAWYQAIPQLLKTQFPDIKAVAKWDNNGGNCQYEMSVSPLTIAGVTAAGHDPYVNQSPPPPQNPVAAFTNSCTDLSCSFDASSSTAPGSTLNSYAWDFGDLATDSTVNPTHTYASANTYTVSLTVTNTEGATNTTTQTVTVPPPPPPPPPAIAFVASASTTANAATETVTVPTAVTAGNGLALIASGASANPLTAPPGWTQVDTVSTSSITSTVWERVATSTDPGSKVTVTFGSLYRGSVQLLAYSGTNGTSPIAAYGKKVNNGTASSYTTPTATVPAAGGYVVSYWTCKSSSVTTWTPPATETIRSTAFGTGGGRISSIATDSGTHPAGVVGGITASPDSSATAFAAWTIVLG